MGQGTVIYPTELGKDGVKHPIVAWGSGSGIQGPDAYAIVTEHVASYGIVVYNSFQSNDGSELLAGIDWLIAENTRPGSMSASSNRPPESVPTVRVRPSACPEPDGSPAASAANGSGSKITARSVSSAPPWNSTAILSVASGQAGRE